MSSGVARFDSSLVYSVVDTATPVREDRMIGSISILSFYTFHVSALVFFSAVGLLFSPITGASDVCFLLSATRIDRIVATSKPGIRLIASNMADLHNV